MLILTLRAVSALPLSTNWAYPGMPNSTCVVRRPLWLICPWALSVGGCRAIAFTPKCSGRAVPDARHGCGASETATSAGRAWRLRTARILCAQRSRRPMGCAVPKPARTCRGMRCARPMVMSHRCLPQLRDAAHLRRRQLSARPDRVAGCRQCADLLLSACGRYRDRSLMGRTDALRPGRCKCAVVHAPATHQSRFKFPARL